MVNQKKYSKYTIHQYCCSDILNQLSLVVDFGHCVKDLKFSGQKHISSKAFEKQLFTKYKSG